MCVYICMCMCLYVRLVVPGNALPGLPSRLRWRDPSLHKVLYRTLPSSQQALTCYLSPARPPARPPPRSFDVPFLLRAFGHSGCLPPHGWAMVDTLDLARAWRPHDKAHGLQARTLDDDPYAL